MDPWVGFPVVGPVGWWLMPLFGSNNTKVGGRQGSIQTGDVASPRITTTFFHGGDTTKDSAFFKINRAPDACGRCGRRLAECECDLAGSSSSGSSGWWGGDNQADGVDGVDSPTPPDSDPLGVGAGPPAGGPPSSGGPSPW